jgi:DNA-directed RNA polymerase I, II, and III subunit RPABC2
MSKRNMSNTKKVDSEESEPESETSDVDSVNINDTDNDDDNDDDVVNEDDDDYNDIVPDDVVPEDDQGCFYNIEQNEINNTQNNVPKEDRISSQFLSKYERVRALGQRARQISLGAKILVKNIDLTTKTPLEIAKIELEHGILPFKIRRTLPNGDVEEWKISELKQKN